LKEQTLISVPDWYFWIDIFVVPQHVDPPENQTGEEQAINFQIFSDGFQLALQDIGRALIVLSPWNKPDSSWMFRIWCLFEFYVMMKFNVPYEFVLPQEQNSSFIRKMGEEGNDFLLMVSTLDMEKAEAFSKYDKIQIQQLVRNDLGGFSKLNERVIAAIRDFCIKKSIFAVRNMTEEEKASNNLLDNSGLMLQDVGDLETALQFFSEALQLKIKRLGPSNVNVAGTHNNIGEVYRHLGDYEKALFHFNKALSIFIPSLGCSHVNVADTKQNIGLVYGKLGNNTKQLQLDREAHSIYLQALGPEHPKTKEIARYI
jgi:tetratricopeptide (TPR) repeat protein